MATTQVVNRAGETGEYPLRNGRYFQMQHYWYYTTREGVNIGPYDSYDEAHLGAQEFIEFICAADQHTVDSFKQYSRMAA